MLAPTHVPRWT